MSRGALDLVVDRLVVDGLDLPPERGEELARLVEEELRPIVAGGAYSALREGTVSSVQPLSLTQPLDLRELARALARRIAARAMEAGGGHA